VSGDIEGPTSVNSPVYPHLVSTASLASYTSDDGKSTVIIGVSYLKVNALGLLKVPRSMGAYSRCDLEYPSPKLEDVAE
jgi:hypothetical protein